MIKANFQAYSTYITESLHQWDINQTLEVTGLNLDSAPEVHFSNSNLDRAIVRQASIWNQVIKVDIPNSLLQEPFRIFAHIGVYEGDTFKVVEVVEIPVKPRKRPADYQLTDKDDEVYSFKRLENLLANRATNAELDKAAEKINARVDNLIAHNNDTDGNSELVDLRNGADGNTYNSAGEAVRTPVARIDAHVKDIQDGGEYCGIAKINQHYYKAAVPFKAGAKYLISIKTNTSFVCSDIQVGTDSVSSAMIDTISTNVQLAANEPTSFYYKASADGLSVICVRNPSGHNLAVEVRRVVTASDVHDVNDAVSFVLPQSFGAVGDGVTDDTDAINAAIEYAYQSGVKNVILPKSADCYRIKQINLKEGVRLLGNGGILKVADNYATDPNQDYFVIYSDANNVTLENLTIYGNSAKNKSFNVCDLITVLGDNVAVKGCKLFDAIDSAIMFSQCKHSFCVNNNIDGARDLGIYVNDGNAGTACLDNVISGNIIDNCANGGIALKRSCQRNLVSDNVISNTTETGAAGISLVRASTSTDFSFDNSITGNRIYSTDVGIYLESSDSNVISGNRVEFFREKGIVLTGVCSNNTITGNNVSQRTDAVLPASDYNGGIIFLNNEGGETKHNVISGNVIATKHNPALSCYTTYSEDTVISKNSITGNVFSSVNSFGVYAFDGLKNNIISGNIFESAKEPFFDAENINASNMGI